MRFCVVCSPRFQQVCSKQVLNWEMLTLRISVHLRNSIHEDGAPSDSPLLFCCVMLNHRRAIPTRAINLASVEAVECQHQLLKHAVSVHGLRCLVCGHIHKHLGIHQLRSPGAFQLARPRSSTEFFRTSSPGEFVGCRRADQEQRMCSG